MITPTTKAYIRKFLGTPIIYLANLVCYGIFKITPQSFWKLDAPIFIIGCPRSGTTLFVDTFSQHLDLVNWSEAGQILQRDYYSPSADHLLEEKHITQFDQARIQVLFKLRVLISGKKRFVNKNPRNSLRIRYLKTLYPNALFIHLVRDAYSVVFSNIKVTENVTFRQKLPYGGFCKPPHWRDYLSEPQHKQFAYQWLGISAYVQEMVENVLTNNNYLEINYEDFCKNPHGTLKYVDHFCGLQTDRRNYKNVPTHFESQNYKWKKGLSDKQLQDITDIVKVKVAI